MSPELAARWTQVLAIGSFICAVLIAAGAYPPLNGSMMVMLDTVDWPVDGATETLTKEARLMSAVGGGVFAGFSVMLLLIVAPALRRGDAEIRKSAIIALIAWYVIDSTGSVAAGVAGNVVFNTIYLAALLAPLALAAKPSRTETGGALQARGM